MSVLRHIFENCSSVNNNSNSYNTNETSVASTGPSALQILARAVLLK